MAHNYLAAEWKPGRYPNLDFCVCVHVVYVNMQVYMYVLCISVYVCVYLCVCLHSCGSHQTTLSVILHAFYPLWDRLSHWSRELAKWAPRALPVSPSPAVRWQAFTTKPGFCFCFCFFLVCLLVFVLVVVVVLCMVSGESRDVTITHLSFWKRHKILVPTSIWESEGCLPP